MTTTPELHRVEAGLRTAKFPDADVDGRVALFASTIDDFVKAYGRRPDWAWWVPGRIEIFGKHTDYAGGRSLVAAVPRGFAVVAAPRTDGLVTARDARWTGAMEVHPESESPDFVGWSNYVAVVARRLARNFPGAPLGVDIAFASDLPRAAGVSSSSALVVGIALALSKRGRLSHRPAWHAAIANRLDLGGYLGAVENGLTFDTLAGTSGVGTHGGSEDHTAILNCQGGRVSAFSYVPTTPEGDAAMPEHWRFIVMASGVEAAKAGAARGRYNQASLATRALADVWRRHTGEQRERTLARVLFDEPDAEHLLRLAIDTHVHQDFSAAVLHRRLAHFVGENARILPALEAFRNQDRKALSELATSTQADAEHLLGNQVAETSALAAMAYPAGAFASSSFGAGFGGSVWALADAADAAAVAERWRGLYLEQFPQHSSARGFLASPSAAALEVDFSA